MVFGTRKNSSIQKFYLGADELKIVDSYKYLGLIIDRNFSWKQHIEKLSLKAQNRMKGIFGLGIGKGLSVKALMRGWEVLVRPLVEFSCEIWGEKDYKMLEDLQVDMGRRVLGVSRMTTREVIQGELGLQRLKARRILARIRFWSKLVKLDKNRLVKKIYNARREEFVRGKKKDKNNWCYWTWKFLCDLGLEHVWNSESFGSRNDWDTVVRLTIQEKEEKIWRDSIKKKPKLRKYRTLKDRLEIESYLHDLRRDEYRQFAMLRGGTNHLRIERGRWEGETVEERKCLVCFCDYIEEIGRAVQQECRDRSRMPSSA
eukprot:TRINITY_DN4852_c0_g5_i3.p1 TRINITY_DN4852_c0_g5~~TRINITY_DN4852_c0_g5_i3.p1  ORF type:complete len:347 (+),score=-26.07 TRINITY_DN4852_c0_g5_i3:97-1041(+)